MKKIIQFFTNPVVISLIGIIALSIIIWFLGPYIKFGESNSAPLASEVSRLIVIIILLVLWGLNNLRVQLKNKKNNKDLVQDLEQSDDVGADFGSDQSIEELNQIGDRFSQALATLSNIKFKGKSKSLYELPWYIIIGPPGSGKTTALVNSTLDFPLADQFGKDSLQGVGGTRNCDWWFTNDAVLIDTAGRYTTQDSHKIVDSKSWDGFLSLLKKHRRRRPINGVIIAISVHDLLLQSQQEREQHTKTIRTRIDEIVQKLEVRFPVYLVLTKTDLVAGFSDYFSDLGTDEREQVWGISLPDAPKSAQGPDLDYLDTEFNRLIERLYARELSRIHNERDVRRRALIQGFPQQIENLKSVVENFIKQTFAENRFEFQPYLRGIYFTSGTQDGTPIDRMMSAVSANFGFDRPNIETQLPQGKSFFLGNLFREVIFPEAELVGTNRKYESLLKWSQRSVYIVMTLVAIGLLTVWSGSINRHNDYMKQVEGFIDEFYTENKRLTLWNKDIALVLPALNALAKASIVYDQVEHPWLSGMGLYDGRVDNSAEDAYHAQLKNLFLPRLIHYLEKRVVQGHAGGDLYHNFRVYMMFNKIEHLEKSLISDWFEESWDASLQGEGTQRQALEVHLQALLDLDPEPYELNKQLVNQTRKLLLRVPVHQRIYSRIRSQNQYSQKVDLLNLFGVSVRETFVISEEVKDSLRIPVLFTKQGYDSVDFSGNSPLLADIVNERWLLSGDKKEKVDFIKDDIDEISQKVKELYLTEYSAHWLKVLKNLNVAKFKNIRTASDSLSRFTDPVYSPLKSVLQVIASHTQLSSPLMWKLDEAQGDGNAGTLNILLAGQFKGNKVDQQFKDLNLLSRESESKPPSVNAILQSIQQLNDYIGQISVSPEPNKKAFELAKARFQSGAGNAITSMHGFSKSNPEPVNRWLAGIADETWKIILSSAKQHVKEEWNNQVYNFCKRAIKGKYPINPKAKNEITMIDFGDFFKPDGKLDKFYLNYVKPFINSNKGWTNRVVDNYSLGFNSTSLKQIKRAQNIKSVFFRNDPSVPGISFQLKPYRMEKIDARFWIDMGNQRVSYSHGPKFWKDLNWAGNEEHNRVRIVFEDLNENPHEKLFEGPWAWFRLQDESKLLKTNQSNVFVVNYSVKDWADDKTAIINRNIQYLIKAKSVNNPFSKNLLGSFRCPKSL